MCRLMGVVGPVPSAQDLVRRFRAAASDGRVPRGAARGHRDGWGILYSEAPGIYRYAGRSVADAATDPEYDRAVAALAGRGSGVLLAHLRKASAGARSLWNTHPFIEREHAFCHNGTIHDLAKAGESDSRALFALVRAEAAKGAATEEALVRALRHVDASKRYTSLTCLLTDGVTLWGARKIGNDPVACADDARPADSYTLGWARVGDATVVTQEQDPLGLAPGAWRPVPDGALLTVGPDGAASVRRVFP